MFEDNKEVIRSRTSKDISYNGQRKKTNRQTMADKIVHKKLYID